MKPPSSPLLFAACLIALAFGGAAPNAHANYRPVELKVPDPAREFRGAWIATVHNIDWPSSNRLSPAQQRAELVGLLDLAAEVGLNAVILQVRTECDAFYKSNLEPWSWFLTGTMGAAPSDGYDPLVFAIQEAHRRGIELHAWFNPFRTSATERSQKSSNHLTRTHSSLMLSSGTQKWGDPSSDLIRKRAIDVMVDVTRRYDVDGVHIDDYFYPYPRTTGGRSFDSFDDSAAYRAYRARGGQLEVKDWRRSNIDNFVSSLYSSVKSAKPHVQVGISPFGIWRPGFPSDTKAGLDAYDHIYADSRKWLRNGWLDYFSPQLYWRIQSDQNFRSLHHWWAGENEKNRHVWPGMASSRILSSEDKGRPASEITDQIAVVRNRPSSQGPGHLHWSIKAIREDRGGLRARLLSAYAENAIPPASPWLGAEAPDPVYVAPAIENGSTLLSFKPATKARWRLIQVHDGGKWTTLRRIPASQETYTIKGTPAEIAIRHVSATGMLSVPTTLKR